MPLAMLLAALVLALAGGAVPAAAQPAQSTSFQANAAHTGHVPDRSLRPPLRRLWARSFPSRVSYPLVADGRVIVTYGWDGIKPVGAGATVVVMDARSGRIVWQRTLHEVFDVHAGYGAGRVVTADSDGFARAFAAEDGRLLWQREVHHFMDDAPLVDGDVVYLTAGSQTVRAMRAADGSDIWRTMPDDNTFDGIPSLDGDRVLIASSGCPDVSALRRSDGAVLWHTPNDCHGGGGATSPVYGGRFYSLEHRLGRPADVYEAATGRVTGYVRSDRIPAFAAGIGVFSEVRWGGEDVHGRGARLTARSVPGGRRLWRFVGDGYIDSPPLIVGSTVYVGSGSGELYALSLRRGRERWSTRLRLPVSGGLAAGGGVLAVPAQRSVVAFGSAPRRR